MALPGSGSTISLNQVNTELGRSATATIDMNDSALRSLFQKTGSGTTISMSDGWGKSNISITVPALGVYGTAYPGGTAYAELIFNSNGTIQYGSSNSGMGGAGSWATPTTTGIGSSYWIRFTQTSSYGASTETGNARGVWHSMASVLYFGVSRTLNGAGGRYYTVQIASNSSGSNIVATRADVNLEVEIIF
jgi:hypothetical protein